MNNTYINFITGKLDFLKTYEYLFLVFICVLFLSILVFFFVSIKSIKSKNTEKHKLIKKEKLLIKLKNSYKNGQINAKEYKERILNLTKDEIL
tara:strand:+ start:351 stop:629 length:279 start_codon:yes stop_codon:yes gene_type:complete